MKFTYIARDARDKIKKGMLEANNLKEATKLLVDKGWYIKKITPKGRLKIKDGFRRLIPNTISLLDKALLAKHLGRMLKSGISISEALEAVDEQTSSKRFKSVINKIIEEIKIGQSLSNALSKFPNIFDSLFINIVKVGEESGTLGENLEYLAEELQDQIELRRHIKSATIYPSIVFSVAFGLVLILVYFILPKIIPLFKIMNSELPLPTKILLWLSDIVDKNGLLIIVGIVAGLIFIYFLLKQKNVKPFWHQFLIKLPVIGNIIINYNLVLISRTLGILLKSGLVIDQAIIITAKTLNNFVYQEKLKNTIPQVQRGKRFSDALVSLKQSKRNPLFPLMVIKMIGIGERTGQLDEPLIHLSEHFQEEVDNTKKNLTTILGPILLIIVGLVVCFIAISVIAPIYQVASELG